MELYDKYYYSFIKTEIVKYTLLSYFFLQLLSS